jgi:Tfp pilus assembly protein PilN
MSARGLLDTDMQTLGQWIGTGWRWWLDELAGMVPPRLRHAAAERLPRRLYRDGELVAEPGARVGRGARVAVIVPRDLCLVRSIERPRLADRDLGRMLSLEAETLFPFARVDMLLAFRRGPAVAGERLSVDVAALPAVHARAVADAVAAARVFAARVQMAAPDETPGAAFDFAPDMRRAGLLAGARSLAPMLWAVVGFLALMNVAVWIWQDAGQVARLEALVREQQPAVAMAQTIVQRGENDQRLVARSLALRRRHDAAGILAEVARALPPGTWLQRYTWDGERVRLAGYRPAKTDVATALRRSGRFAQVRSESADTEAALPTGEPFDLSARPVPR